MPKTATADRVERTALLDFLRARNQAVLVTRKQSGGVQMSPVTYGVDGDGRVVVSTYPQRAKVTNVRRDPAVSLCVLSSDWNGKGSSCPHHSQARGGPLQEDRVPPLGLRIALSPGRDDPAGEVAAADHRDRLGTHRQRRIPTRGN